MDVKRDEVARGQDWLFEGGHDVGSRIVERELKAVDVFLYQRVAYDQAVAAGGRLSAKLERAGVVRA